MGFSEPAPLSATTCRVTFDEVQFAFFHLVADAIPQFARQSPATERILTLAKRIFRLACGFACLGSEQPLADEKFGVLGVLFQVLGQPVTHCHVDDALNVAVSQLRLGLAFELRMGHTNRNNAGQSFAEIVSRGSQILEQVLFLAVVVQCSRQGRTETRDVRTAFDGMDIVRVGLQRFGVLLGVLQRDGVTDRVLDSMDHDHVLVNHIAGSVQELNKLLNASLVAELVALVAPFIADANANTTVQERKFLETFCQGVVEELGVWENLRIGLEGGLCAPFGRHSGIAHWTRCNPALIRLRRNLAIAVNLHLAPLREKIHNRHTDAVQSTRSLISLLIELATELENRHHTLQGADIASHFLGKVCVAFDRDTPTVVLDRHRTIGIDENGNHLRELRHRFIDGVVHNFIHQVVQSLERGVPDVHPRPGTDVLQIVEELQILRVVIGPIERHLLWALVVLAFVRTSVATWI